MQYHLLAQKYDIRVLAKPMVSSEKIVGNSIFSAPIIYLPTVNSTNNYAAELIKSGEVAHGTVILADEQTAGRGQRERQWTSVAGQDLTFTMVLRPDGLPIDKQVNISHLAALSVHDMLEANGVQDVKVKWPNDILVGEKKIAGILIENTLDNEFVEYAAIGIGMNIGRKDFPQALKATSLTILQEDPLGIRLILDLFLGIFKQKYDNWVAREYEFIEIDPYLWQRGNWGDFELDDEPVLAKPLTVNDKGQLVIEREDGKVLALGTERLRQIRS